MGRDGARELDRQWVALSDDGVRCGRYPCRTALGGESGREGREGGQEGPKERHGHAHITGGHRLEDGVEGKGRVLKTR
jgi:hypothetical protein